jgi:hypothetical protein
MLICTLMLYILIERSEYEMFEVTQANSMLQYMKAKT